MQKMQTQVQSLGREGPWEEAWKPTAVVLPGRPHGQRSLVGYGAFGHKESDSKSKSCSHHRKSRLKALLVRAGGPGSPRWPPSRSEHPDPAWLCSLLQQ